MEGSVFGAPRGQGIQPDSILGEYSVSGGYVIKQEVIRNDRALTSIYL